MYPKFNTDFIFQDYSGMFVDILIAFISFIKNNIRFNIMYLKFNKDLIFQDYLKYIAIIGLLSNMFLMISINLNENALSTPLWAIFSVYITYIIFLVNKGYRIDWLKNKYIRKEYIAVFIVVFLLYKINDRFNSNYIERNKVINPVVKLLEKYNIKRIYGNWYMMYLPVYIPKIKTASIEENINDKNLVWRSWLSTKYSSCALPNENVMYIIDNNTEIGKHYENILVEAGIPIVDKGKIIPNKTIFIGKSILQGREKECKK